MSLSEQARNKQRSTDLLGATVDVAVVAYRHVNPRAWSMFVIFSPLIFDAVANPTWMTWVLVVVPSLAGLWLLFLLTRPTVLVTRVHDRIVVLRTPLLRPTHPSDHVIADYDIRTTATALGPPSWGYRPLMLTYHRYWISYLDGEAAEQLLRTGNADHPSGNIP